MSSLRVKRLAALGAAVAAAAGTTLLTAGPAHSAPGPSTWTNVAAPNAKAVGVVAPDVLSPQLRQVAVAQGATPLENGTPAVPYYGYDGDQSTMVPLPSAPTTEAHKTEPDKNTYLVFGRSLPGGDPNYYYGTHFLFQGHESGSPGYITRVNLDADKAHRVTLMATQDTSGAPLPDFDGSTWDPFAHELLFTYEGGTSGGVWMSDLGVPSTVVNMTGILGNGGYEGIQNDNRGNVYIVEDSGGKGGPNTPNAKQPNSFIFRFVPYNPANLLAGGRLQALQVIDGDHPIVFHPGQNDQDILSQDMADLHTYGMSFATHWVTVHDTRTDGTTPFDANGLAKTDMATPFKRPENGVFAPDGGFHNFYFTETGDTNALTEAGSTYGGFGGIFHLTQNPASDNGKIQIFYRGDVDHTGLDNITFVGRNQVAAVEDAGDTLHTQRNALDSAYLFDIRADYSTATEPVRFLAQGRDTSATIDSACGGACGNEGDNEITGIHASNGDPSFLGILGQSAPTLFDGKWRLFYTRQHGDNVTFEILPASGH